MDSEMGQEIPKWMSVLTLSGCTAFKLELLFKKGNRHIEVEYGRGECNVLESNMIFVFSCHVAYGLITILI